MHDKKYAEQLALAIDGSGLTKREIAARTYMSETAVGKHALGQRGADHDKKKSFWDLLHGLRLGLSSARADFGTISYMDDPRINHDVYGATQTADREEHERRAIWPEFNAAVVVERSKRTRPQAECVDNGLTEFAQEIGAELTDFIELAEYAGVDAQQYIDDFNNRIGG